MGGRGLLTAMLYFFLLIALLIPLMAVFLDSRVGQALAARLERSPGPAQPDERTAALEAEVERLADEVRRLREQGEFIERLLASRAAGELPPAGGATRALPRERSPREGGEGDE